MTELLLQPQRSCWMIIRSALLECESNVTWCLFRSKRRQAHPLRAALFALLLLVIYLLLDTTSIVCGAELVFSICFVKRSSVFEGYRAEPSPFLSVQT